jgi:hypothetical protein
VVIWFESVTRRRGVGFDGPVEGRVLMAVNGFAVVGEASSMAAA